MGKATRSTQRAGSRCSCGPSASRGVGHIQIRHIQVHGDPPELQILPSVLVSDQLSVKDPCRACQTRQLAVAMQQHPPGCHEPEHPDDPSSFTPAKAPMHGVSPPGSQLAFRTSNASMGRGIRATRYGTIAVISGAQTPPKSGVRLGTNPLWSERQASSTLLDLAAQVRAGRRHGKIVDADFHRRARPAHGKAGFQ